MAFGLYRIDKDHLRLLKEHDPNVYDPVHNLYYGSVFTKYDEKRWCYFALVVEDMDEKWEFPMQKIVNGVFCDVECRRMIPCHEKLLTPDYTDAKKGKTALRQQKAN